MSTEEENYSKTPLIVAKVSLILAIIAFGITVLLAVPILRKYYSSTPTTPVVPVAPSRSQTLPSSRRTTNSEPMRSSSTSLIYSTATVGD